MSLIKPEQLRSGSYNITGSLFGTSSLALTASYFSGSITSATSASYALTASYALNAGISTPFRIATGSISASVNVGPNIFLITSNNQPVLTISQSGVILLATQSEELAGPAPNGGIYFTPSSFYVGLD